jgi:outer membrane protein OmpA-like peptidoglycan-associated protein/tetratricopeptide (TPR) repeat protein
MKTVPLIAFFLVVHLALFSQEKTSEDFKELFYDAEFFFAQEEYTDALYDYLEIYNNGYKENANINYRMGICYLNIPGQKDKAITHLLEAVKNVSKKYEANFKQITAPFDAYLFLGNAYRVNYRLEEAIAAYNKYKEIVGVAEEIKYADQQIEACRIALKYMDNPLKIQLTNLGDSVNSSSSNFKGVVSGNGKTLLYMNELPFYDAVYYSTYTPHGWSAPVNITPQIQSDGDQYVSSVSYDGDLLILTKEDAFNSDLYISKYKDGKWSKSLPIEGQEINTKFWESHASISRDGNTLYFTSNRKDGYGEMDIYLSKKGANGSWGSPVNVGPVVNTILNEDTPFITDNDSLLYFSSQGHESMGGYDIFVTSLDTNGQWSQPKNIRYPINTTDDDLFFYPWNDARVGYVSRIENDGLGKEDIYVVQAYGDKDYAELMAGFLNVGKPATVVDSEVIPVGDLTENPEAADEKPADEPVAAVKVSPKEIVLEPVYFSFDHFELTVNGKGQLEKVARFMKDYPEARIRLIGHADAKGPAEYNQKLSEKRANTALSYITALGIAAGRIEAVGLGEKNFAAINSNPDGTDNPEGRGLNRRVEYEIIGTDDKLIIVRMPPIPEHLKFRQ